MGSISGTDFLFKGQTNIYRGKVRDVYTINDDTLVSIATDRISAFDVILPQPIPHKGQVLNQLAAHFLAATIDIAPNWLIEMPDPNVSIGHKCEPFAIEMVIRGCLVGHAWRVYQAGVRELCGVQLPDGMQEYDMFDEPVITPSTKSHTGHDEDITAMEIVEQGLASESDFERLSIMARQLFIRGRQQARDQGLVLADTKYEFGKYNGEIFVIDEIHTPDSSRYFYVDGYEAYLKDRTGEVPRNLSKEFVRRWLLDQGFSGLEGQKVPELDDEFVELVSQRYSELYEQ
ncbi:MAG: phosphoribosylaminoimidazolesuccinocarboxamide synthase [Candidatus Saccharimonadales bacterium]